MTPSAPPERLEYCFDAKTGRPAEPGGYALIGLEQEDAFYFCLLMNKGVAVTPALMRRSARTRPPTGRSGKIAS